MTNSNNLLSRNHGRKAKVMIVNDVGKSKGMILSNATKQE
jgi:hypothetical protein